MKTEKDFWNHDFQGEKHRIKFCASEDIILTGLGFLVTMGRHDHSPLTTGEDFYNVRSSKSTVALKLQKPLSLSCDKIYLLSVNLHGGASIVGRGGAEFVGVDRGGDKPDVLFKFETYKEERTNVEKGVIEKIYFDLF